MQYKDLGTITDGASRHFRDTSLPLTLNGKVQPLTEREVVAMSYFNSVVDLLIKRGLMEWTEHLNFEIVEPDSNPMEDDYA